MKIASRRATAGFTLLELLVAIAITVIIGVAATVVFGAAVENREHVGERARALAELQRAFLFMQRDFEQVVARPARDELGDPQAFLLSTGDGGVELTRTGWMNPLETRPRSHLQRVRYRLDGDRLLREYWDHTDRAAGSTPLSSAIATRVKGFRVQYLYLTPQGGYEWQDDWPRETGEAQAPAVQQAPVAVAVELEMEPFGTLRRFFRVPANPHARET